MDIITKRNLGQGQFWGRTEEISFLDLAELTAEELALIVYNICLVQHSLERITFVKRITFDRGWFSKIIEILRRVYWKGIRDLPHLEEVVIRDNWGHYNSIDSFPAIPTLKRIDLRGCYVAEREVLDLQARLNAAKSKIAKPVEILWDALVHPPSKKEL